MDPEGPRTRESFSQVSDQPLEKLLLVDEAVSCSILSGLYLYWVREFLPLNLRMPWAERFSLLHRRMEWAGLDPGGLGPETASSKMCTQWHFLVDVKLKLKADLAKIKKKKKGVNEYFPFLFGNCGKITELGVSWVFFHPPPSSLSCILLHLLPFFLKKKDTKGKGPFTTFVRYQNEC